MTLPDSDDQAAELLRRLRVDDPESLTRFVDEFRRLTGLTALSDDEWRRLFRAGLDVALTGGHWLSAAELAHVALSRHELEGRMEKFVEESGVTFSLKDVPGYHAGRPVERATEGTTA